ncbi:MAG: hypothetical protein H7336_00520 [Bacteriovorax sp.]|nr:hypothetical protein [Bacteriovorax sp.]
MGISHIFKFMLVLAMASQAFAEDMNVQTLSEGACWLESGDMVKVASFNDKESALLSRDEIEMQVEGLLGGKKNKAITSDLTLHCGGYGSSLVIKSEMDGKPICLWVKFNKGRLALRSLGGLENSKGDVCDGYKWGELIIGIKTPEQKALLESEHFHGMVKAVSVVSGTTLKITLDKSYDGREMDAMAELKKQMELRYIELNLFQHPVGEAAAIK